MSLRVKYLDGKRCLYGREYHAYLEEVIFRVQKSQEKMNGYSSHPNLPL